MYFIVIIEYEIESLSSWDIMSISTILMSIKIQDPTYYMSTVAGAKFRQAFDTHNFSLWPTFLICLCLSINSHANALLDKCTLVVHSFLHQPHRLRDVACQLGPRKSHYSRVPIDGAHQCLLLLSIPHCQVHGVTPNKWI